MFLVSYFENLELISEFLEWLDSSNPLIPDNPDNKEKILQIEKFETFLLTLLLKTEWRRLGKARS